MKWGEIFNINLAAFFFFLDALVISFFASVFYPGYLNLDSLYMLGQVSGVFPFSNWHPPFLTLLWSLLLALFRTAGGVWLFQIILYVYAVHLFSITIRNKFLSLITYLFFIFYPPIFTTMGALWKDSWVIIFALFCVTFCLWAIRYPCKENIILSLLFVLFTSLTRTDYFIIVLPMGIGAVLYGRPKEWIRKNTDIKIGIATGISILSALILISYLLTGLVSVKLHSWFPTIAWDMAGIQRFTNETQPFPEYKCATSDPLIFGEYEAFKELLPGKENQSTMRITFYWVSKIVQNPVAYLKHRLCVMTAFLGFGVIHRPYIEPEVLEFSFVQKIQKSPLNAILHHWFEKMPEGLMFRYWIYLVLAFFIACTSFWARTFDHAQRIVVLSIFLGISRVIILPATDFRYGLWIIMGTFILGALFMDEILSYDHSSRRKTKFTDILLRPYIRGR